MDVRRLSLAIGMVLLALAAGCSRKPRTPAVPPVEIASRWWRAVVSGDRSAAFALADAAARADGERQFEELARVRAAAAAGDQLAQLMLKRLDTVHVGAANSGGVLAMVPLVMDDGRTLVTVKMNLRDNRWVIVAFK